MVCSRHRLSRVASDIDPLAAGTPSLVPPGRTGRWPGRIFLLSLGYTEVLVRIHLVTYRHSKVLHISCIRIGILQTSATSVRED
jgi:hypothetical protein